MYLYYYIYICDVVGKLLSGDTEIPAWTGNTALWTSPNLNNSLSKFPTEDFPVSNNIVIHEGTYNSIKSYFYII